MSMAKEENVNLNEIPDFTNLKQVLDSNQPFYYLEIPSEDAEKCFSHVRYLCEIRGNHFPMNFGRLKLISSYYFLKFCSFIFFKF